jgi:hypothetical protein
MKHQEFTQPSASINIKSRAVERFVVKKDCHDRKFTEPEKNRL